jgi:hypothetical protein
MGRLESMMSLDLTSNCKQTRTGRSVWEMPIRHLKPASRKEIRMKQTGQRLEKVGGGSICRPSSICQHGYKCEARRGSD